MSPVFGVGSSGEDGCGVRQTGENEDPFASVRCANVGSSNACPVRVIPERGQVAEYSAETAAAECGDVLHDDEFGS